MDLKMKQLAMAAIEMNTVMGLKPKIKTVGCTTESLIEEILTNAAEIDPELDEFSPETEAVLRKLKCWPGTEAKQEEPDDEDDEEPVAPVKKKKPAPEPDPDEDDEMEDEPVSKPKRPIQREEDDDVVVRSRAEKQTRPVPEKVYDKPEKVKKEIPFKKSSYSRNHALLDALKKGGSKTELAQMVDEFYEKNGGMANPKGAKATVDISLPTLLVFKAVKEINGKFQLA